MRPGRPARHCASTAATGTPPRSLANGLSGLESHLLAAATKAIPTAVLRENRGWSEEEWGAALEALRVRGLLHGDGRATDTGRSLHGAVEDLTDRLAEPAYAALSDGARADLHGALWACAIEIAASGLLPFPNPMGLPRARAG